MIRRKYYKGTFIDSLVQKARKNKNKIGVTIIILSILFTLLGGFSFNKQEPLSVILEKDTIEVPSSMNLEINREVGLQELYFSVSLDEQVRLRGGCADLVGGRYISKKDSQLQCQKAGFKDVGCGWNEETACNCHTGQTGCFKHEITPITEPVIVIVDQTPVATITNKEETVNTTNIASLINLYCENVFRELDKDPFNKQKDCFVPIQIIGGKATLFITHTFKSSGFKDPNLYPRLIWPDTCTNNKTDSTELYIDCGGTCGKCTETGITIEKEQYDGSIIQETLLFKDIPEQGLLLPDGRTIYAPRQELISGKTFDITRISTTSWIGGILGIISGLLIIFTNKILIGVLLSLTGTIITIIGWLL